MHQFSFWALLRQQVVPHELKGQARCLVFYENKTRHFRPALRPANLPAAFKQQSTTLLRYARNLSASNWPWQQKNCQLPRTKNLRYVHDGWNSKLKGQEFTTWRFQTLLSYYFLHASLWFSYIVCKSSRSQCVLRSIFSLWLLQLYKTYVALQCQLKCTSVKKKNSYQNDDY